MAGLHRSLFHLSEAGLVDRHTFSSEVLWVFNSRNNVTSHIVTDLEEKVLQKCYFITDLIH